MHGKTGYCANSTFPQPPPRSQGQCCAATKGPNYEMAKGCQGCECCPDGCCPGGQCCSGGNQPVYSRNKEYCTEKGNCNDHHHHQQQGSKAAYSAPALDDQLMQKCTVTCECNGCGDGNCCGNGDRKASAGNCYQESKRHHVTNSSCAAKESSAGSGGCCSRPADQQEQKCIVTCDFSCSGPSPQQVQQQRAGHCRDGCSCCGGGRNRGECRCDCTCSGSCSCSCCCGQSGKVTPNVQGEPCCKVTCQC